MDSHQSSVNFYVLVRTLIAARHFFIFLEAERFELEAIELQTAGSLMMHDNYILTDEGTKTQRSQMSNINIIAI